MTLIYKNLSYDLLHGEFRVNMSRFWETVDMTDALNERERQMLHLRFDCYGNVQFSYKKIAAKFEISPERAGQILNKALRKMQHGSRSKNYIVGKL